jgi:hypothetical protein
VIECRGTVVGWALMRKGLVGYIEGHTSLATQHEAATEAHCAQGIEAIRVLYDACFKG